jgi:trans-2,3-dihydro-3-hydroxyanthranilate isomerase
MKYTFHIVDVFSSTPFGGNRLAVLPDAAGIETIFVLPKNDPANPCRVRIFAPRTELDFAGHPTVGTGCALVMKQEVLRKRVLPHCATGPANHYLRRGG